MSIAPTLAALGAVTAGAWAIAARAAGLTLRNGAACDPTNESLEEWSRAKRFIDIGDSRVAYVDAGQGTPVVLLHGCPFHSYEWHKVFPALAERHRVIAPDLRGLGDTVVGLDDDYRLPTDVTMVVGLLDALGLDEVHLVGHDHGGATALLMMDEHADRMRSLVLTNIEAYDEWPSKPERKYLKAVVNPVTSPLFKIALGFKPIQRECFSIAAHDPDSFTDEMLDAFTRPHIASAARWARLRRFFCWQLDSDHNAVTMGAVDAMRRFHRPTLLVWGRNDTNFGPHLAERLAGDIPGVVGTKWMEHSAHMPMLEEPQAYADAVLGLFESVEAGVDPARAL